MSDDEQDLRSASDLDYDEPSTISEEILGSPIKPRIVRKVERYYGYKCVLCSSNDRVVVVCTVLQGPYDLNPLPWLVDLGVLRPGSFDMDGFENLMLLCEPHANAYHNEVWRWLPSSTYRAAMSTMANSAPKEVAIDFPDDEEDIKPEITFAPLATTPFDVLVYRPGEMPPIDGRVSGITNDPSGDERVIAHWRDLPLDPCVVYAAALPMVGAAYVPHPDNALREIERECIAIRASWNASVPRGSRPCDFVIG
ncbi:hypothetical protein C8Q78DRAFT_996174 [Trametes maxima]|nr:hypothetical protein C8Q78DRAFT_996174 [Trametes maxima]